MKLDLEIEQLEELYRQTLADEAVNKPGTRVLLASRLIKKKIDSKKNRRSALNRHSSVRVSKNQSRIIELAIRKAAWDKAEADVSKAGFDYVENPHNYSEAELKAQLRSAQTRARNKKRAYMNWLMKFQSEKQEVE